MADTNLSKNNGAGTNVNKNVSDALNQLNSGDAAKKIDELKNNEKLMEQLVGAVADNPELANAAPKFMGDPRVNQFLKDNPDMNRKKAVQMKKQMNKVNHQRRMKMEKVEGCMINTGRKLKPVTIVIKDGNPDEKEINSYLNAKHMHRREVENFWVYYDSDSKAKNKRVTKVFGNEIVGNNVVILSSEGNLSVKEFEKWETSK